MPYASLLLLQRSCTTTAEMSSSAQLRRRRQARPRARQPTCRVGPSLLFDIRDVDDDEARMMLKDGTIVRSAGRLNVPVRRLGMLAGQL